MQHSTLMRISMGLGLALLLGAPAAPAGADTYSWRTEDGVYAYTDDPKHIPARYADEAKILRRGSLKSYKRYTAQDSAATDRYASRLSARLNYLRQVNAQPEAAPAMPALASAGTRSGGAISFSTGGPNDARLQIPFGEQADGPPVVVEPINAKRTGDPRTRRVTLVKQGGKIVAVLKGTPKVHNPSTDFGDEDALEEGEY
jgi:hypothetical protein